MQPIIRKVNDFNTAKLMLEIADEMNVPNTFDKSERWYIVSFNPENNTVWNNLNKRLHAELPKTFGQLPDLAAPLQKIKIMLDLEAKTDQNTIVGHSILKAIYDKQKPDSIIDYVRSQASDNKELMYDVIGQELTERILNFAQ